MLANPILPGFHPDPSILRAGDDYYIAVSTFEWFPGVLVYHSRNLSDWQLVARPLDRLSQLDMTGNPDSGGIWAPCLSYDGSRFYLVYTDVKSLKGMWRDMHNYLVVSDSITGPWSDPIVLNGVGHDPSLFHDSDGRKYLLQVEWDYHGGKNHFGGISLQEFDPSACKLIGKRRIIYKGTGRGFTEAPHLYLHNGMYHLLVAEGGTWYEHCAVMARSPSINGPYENHPDNPILGSIEDEAAALQKAGHASLVETTDGRWFLAFLCGRPLSRRGRCVLGRETALQETRWRPDGWLSLANGKRVPDLEVDLPASTRHPKCQYDDFLGESLDPVFQSLRIPLGEESASLVARKGYLRLYGAESLSSIHKQALIARRQQAFSYEAETCFEFDPTSSQHMAGLVAYYNTENHVYACVSYHERLGVVLRVIHCHKGKCSDPTGDGVPIEPAGRYRIRLQVERETARFSLFEGERWLPIGGRFDYSELSDDFITGRAFTGTFIGICCQDLSGDGVHADFDWFRYDET